jgi:hypothetical protein
VSEERDTQAEHAEILDASPPACVCASAAIDVAPRGDQLLHRVRLPVLRRDVDRRPSILEESVVGWCGVVEEASGGGGYTHTHTHNTHTHTHTHT